jgi:3-methyladenine DNA glycosylase AlkD
MIDPKTLTEEMMDEVANSFDSIEVCDETCINLFIKNKWALHKTVEWAKEDKLYIKRAAFIMMGALARDDKEIQEFVFRVFIPIMIRESMDEQVEIQEAINYHM